MNERKNCAGCQLYEDYDGTMMCSNAITWIGGTPPDPDCYVHDAATLAAIAIERARASSRTAVRKTRTGGRRKK